MNRILTVLIVMTLIASLIIGCGTSIVQTAITGHKIIKNSPMDASADMNFTSVKAGEKVIMRFVHAGSSEGEKSFMNNFKKYYDAKNPRIMIDFLVIPGGELLQKLTVMTKAGDWPDVMGVLDIGDLVAMNTLEPLDTYLSKDEKVKKENILPAALKYSQVGGRTYALPITAIGYGLMVNTNLLKNTGIKLDDIKTWDDLLKAAKEMTIGDAYGYGFCGVTPRFMYRDFYISALSNGITMDKMSDPANKSKMMELLDFYQKLNPYIIPNRASIEWVDIHKYVIDDKCGMLTTGTYYESYMYGLNDNCIEYIKPIAYPKGPSAGAATAYVSNYAYAITKGSQHKDIAWDIIRETHLCDAGIEFTGSIHTAADLTFDKDKVKASINKYFGTHLQAQLGILDRWKNILANGVPQPVILGQTDIERSYQELMLGFLSGKINAQQFYIQWMSELKQIQANFKK